MSYCLTRTIFRDGSPRNLTEADGSWRMLTSGKTSLKTDIYAKLANGNWLPGPSPTCHVFWIGRYIWGLKSGDADGGSHWTSQRWKLQFKLKSGPGALAAGPLLHVMLSELANICGDGIPWKLTEAYGSRRNLKLGKTSLRTEI